MAQQGQQRGENAAAYLRVILLAAAIGIPAAFLAAAFLAAVHWLENWLWTDLPHDLGATTPPWYLVLGLPVAGAGVVIAARVLLPGDGGHPPLNGLSTKPTPLRYGPGVALAALGTLAFGPVLGPEAPLIALGSVVGMTVAPFMKNDPQAQSVLATAGSFSAISALFGGPLVAGMLLTEAAVGMGTALIPALLPGLVAAAIGYVIFLGLGTWGGIHQSVLTVPGLPKYHSTSVPDLLIGIGVGIAAALVIAVVRLIGNRVDGLPLHRGPAAGHGHARLATLLLGGALVVGLLALLARALGADSQDVLFSGQASVPALVAQQSLKIVLVLLVAKALAYAVSLGCGFRGGPVFPAIFLGVALASLAEIIFNTSPTLAVAVGAAGGMAAMTRLLFAPVLFAILLVGDNGLGTVSAAVLASAAAWLLTMTLERRQEAAAAAARASPTTAGSPG
ncbi:MAG TPA: chloride channel protein [Streptosporangiaceae bacterium]